MPQRLRGGVGGARGSRGARRCRSRRVPGCRSSAAGTPNAWNTVRAPPAPCPAAAPAQSVRMPTWVQTSVGSAHSGVKWRQRGAPRATCCQRTSTNIWIRMSAALTVTRGTSDGLSSARLSRARQVERAARPGVDAQIIWEGLHYAARAGEVHPQLVHGRWGVVRGAFVLFALAAPGKLGGGWPRERPGAGATARRVPRHAADRRVDSSCC